MKPVAVFYNGMWTAALRFAGALAFTLTLSPALASADNADPFQMNASVWKSLDSYKQDQKDPSAAAATPASPALPLTSSAAPQVATPTLGSNKDQASLAPAVSAPSTMMGAPAVSPADVATASVLAPPERPLNEPVLPGVNKTVGATALSSSTDSDTYKSEAHVANMDTQPDLQLANQDWIEASQALREQADIHAASKRQGQVNVRFAFLPAVRSLQPLMPTTAAKPASAPEKSATVATAIPAPLSTPAAKETAANCAAIDQYKKQQLEALQSDHHTLTALRDAIKDLGLNKQLDFMVGNNVARTDSAAKP